MSRAKYRQVMAVFVINSQKNEYDTVIMIAVGYFNSDILLKCIFPKVTV